MGIYIYRNPTGRVMCIVSCMLVANNASYTTYIIM